MLSVEPARPHAGREALDFASRRTPLVNATALVTTDREYPRLTLIRLATDCGWTCDSRRPARRRTGWGSARGDSVMRRTFLGVINLAICMASATSFGQQQAPPITGAQSDVVSIKLHPYDPAAGGGIRTLPDGTFMMTSQPILSIIPAASPVPVSPREIVGLPRLGPNGELQHHRQARVRLEPHAGAARRDDAQPAHRADEGGRPHRRAGAHDVCPCRRAQ
jgi:hypothetical protein